MPDSNDFIVRGKLHKKLEPISGSSNGRDWSRTGFVIDAGDGMRPSYIAFDLWNERADMLNAFHEGDIVEVRFSAASRDYQGKWYTNLQAWSVQQPQAQPQPQNYQQPQPGYQQPQQWAPVPQQNPYAQPGAYQQNPYGQPQQVSQQAPFGQFPQQQQAPMGNQQPYGGGYQQPAQPAQPMQTPVAPQTNPQETPSTLESDLPF